MPDVIRSDSIRSDTSLRPRVSFNRDVHVKRIVPSDKNHPDGASSSDKSGHLGISPIRRERLKKSKQEVIQQAPHVAHRSDKINCTTKSRAISPEKFYTLPRGQKEKIDEIGFLSSLDRKRKVKKSVEGNSKTLKKIQVPSSPRYNNQNNKQTYTLFRKNNDEGGSVKVDLRRSASDATNLKSFGFKNALNEKKCIDIEFSDISSNTKYTNLLKKQLSPIVEGTTCDNPFPLGKDNHKQNNENASNFDCVIRKEIHIDKTNYSPQNDYDGNKCKTNQNEKKIFVIDIDQAENISKSRKSKIKNYFFGKKNKFLASEKNKIKQLDQSQEKSPGTSKEIKFSQHSKRSPQKDSIQNLKNCTYLSEKMIESSRRPTQKLPLTKSHTVDLIVRQLTKDNSSPPPKPNVMVIPNASIQHNNNQPFSYTRGLSPEKYVHESSKNPCIPIVYAQVVCSNDRRGQIKQTVHKTYNKKNYYSDSDEGLGNEENSGCTTTNCKVEKTLTHFGDDIKTQQESPIMPKYKFVPHNFDQEDSFTFQNGNNIFMDSSTRGRADGMDAKRRESLSEQTEDDFVASRFDSTRNTLSARRDLLEFRINRKIHNKLGVEEKFNRSSSSSPSRVTSECENSMPARELESVSNVQMEDYKPNSKKEIETSQKSRNVKSSTLLQKGFYKSTPNIYYDRTESPVCQYSFHDSLRRDKNVSSRIGNSKERFENDVKRDCKMNIVYRQKQPHFRDNYADSEDEGFASSLLITSEKQQTEEIINKTLPKNYDSDAVWSGEDDTHRYLNTVDYNVHRNNEYIPRERSIDDGSHFDPRLDKGTFKEQQTVKRKERKPAKSEKRGSLEKVKQLFTWDSKKKKEKQKMVREESLWARYKEYKGSIDDIDQKQNEESIEIISDYRNRRRLSTPSPSPSPVHELQENEKLLNSGGKLIFKSQDTLPRDKNKKKANKSGEKNNKGHEIVFEKQIPSKNLRFFGDSDVDSNDSIRKSFTLKPLITSKSHFKSHSTKELHNIIEEIDNSKIKKKKQSHKSMLNISDSTKEPENFRLKPPISPNTRTYYEIPKSKETKRRRKRCELNLVESSTEGDSSQQSQRSVVYLHAATVGDIPGPTVSKYAQKVSSKEELTANDSSWIQPQVKTLSRSFSVLAPWTPRHQYEKFDINYGYNSHSTKNGKYEEKMSKIGSSDRKENISTLKKKSTDSSTEDKRVNSSTLDRKFKSKDNSSKIAREEPTTKTSTLYRKKERLPRENSRYSRDKEDRKAAAKSASVESLKLGRKGKDIIRSVSMPKNSEKQAGWFKINKKKHHNSDYIMQRL